MAVEFSIIVPVFNEAGNVAPLIEEIAVALDGRSFEIVFVDDASTDDTRAELVKAKAAFDCLRVVAHRLNAGQSRAIRTGVEAASGEVIGILDGDGQSDPSDLPILYRQLMRSNRPDDLALIMGQRNGRFDTFEKKAASWIANAARSRILKDEAVDSGCALKVMRRDAFLKLPYFDHMHRYMPALVQSEGGVVEYVSVNHRPRQYGRSKYSNWRRLWPAFRDLCGVLWLRRRRRSFGGVDEF